MGVLGQGWRGGEGGEPAGSGPSVSFSGEHASATVCSDPGGVHAWDLFKASLPACHQHTWVAET